MEKTLGATWLLAEYFQLLENVDKICWGVVLVSNRMTTKLLFVAVSGITHEEYERKNIGRHFAVSLIFERERKDLP